MQSSRSLDLYHSKIAYPVFQSCPNGCKPVATTDEPTLTSSSPSTTVNAVSRQCIAPATTNTKEEGECPPQNSTVAEMGYHVKRTKLQPPARFYLRTNGKKPFCLLC
ncbi:hypothetical protein AVEN_201958-1 [Araneus ventricosus]|uniref:Uncharacterized protein n=1 Tax=Araneus ventricosus TaxID=182803 RepID=A0A4Y2Q8S8_ARAVE|nr:hypothetical protein AVEN_201958-1 [Araneus ventricosus]